MLSILGRIYPGTWELGNTVGTVDSKRTFIATASPTASVTFSGGTLLRSYTAIVGWLIPGRIELGQIRPDLVLRNRLGFVSFIGTASPQANFQGTTVPTANFFGTAFPQAFFGVGIAFVGTAECDFTVTAVLSNNFVATASPQASFAPQAGQDVICIVNGPTSNTKVAQNFAL